MSLTVSVAETAIPGAIAPSSISAQSIASDGDVGFGGFMIDDPGASIVTTGHKSVTVEESSCSQPRLFTGYLTDRDSGRSAERGMLIDDDRLHEATMVDLNACLSFRHLRGTESERPSETMGARLTWLLGTDQVSQFITGTAFATLYSNTMDAANYRGAYPKAVLDDLAGRRANLTYFVFWDPIAEEVALYFGDDSTGIADSTLSISNDIADINGTTVFPPDTTATLKRSPEEVYSEVTVLYAHGTKRLYRRRASTATAYIDRGTTIEKPYTGSETTAQGQAEAFLDEHSIEKDTITVTIIVPPESAGLVTAGQRINVRFTHLDDYTGWTSMRVVSVNVRPLNDVANRYALDLELELPLAGTAPAPAGVVQFAVDEDSGFGPRVTFDDLPSAGHTFVGFSAQRAENSSWDEASGYVPIAYDPDAAPPDYVTGTEWDWLAAMAVRGGNDYPITMAEKYPTDSTDALYTQWEWQNGDSGGKRAYHVEASGIGSATAFGTDLYTIAVSAVDVTLTGEPIVLSSAGILFIGSSYTASGPADGSSPSMYGAVSGTGVILGQGYIGTDPIDGFAPFTWFAQLNQVAAGTVTPSYTISVVPRNATRAAGYVWAFYPTSDSDETDPDTPTPGSIVTSAVTPLPDGAGVEFTTSTSYQPGSLVVFVTGVAVAGGYVYETDAGAGTFQLAWAPDSDESIFASYIAGG